MSSTAPVCTRLRFTVFPIMSRPGQAKMASHTHTVLRSPLRRDPQVSHGCPPPGPQTAARAVEVRGRSELAALRVQARMIAPLAVSVLQIGPPAVTRTVD